MSDAGKNQTLFIFEIDINHPFIKIYFFVDANEWFRYNLGIILR